MPAACLAFISLLWTELPSCKWHRCQFMVSYGLPHMAQIQIQEWFPKCVLLFGLLFKPPQKSVVCWGIPWHLPCLSVPSLTSGADSTLILCCPSTQHLPLPLQCIPCMCELACTEGCMLSRPWQFSSVLEATSTFSLTWHLSLDLWLHLYSNTRLKFIYSFPWVSLQSQGTLFKSLDLF